MQISDLRNEITRPKWKQAFLATMYQLLQINLSLV